MGLGVVVVVVVVRVLEGQIRMLESTVRRSQYWLVAAHVGWC